MTDRLEQLTITNIDALTFADLVALVDEPNQPSGGVATIRRIVSLVRLRHSARVLEIGSNTGFTSLELASWIDGQVIGVDVLERATHLARQAAVGAGVENTMFLTADATALPFSDSWFDLVWASNVSSFIRDKEKAISEYLRVTRRFGFIVVVPIYYYTPPPPQLKLDVEKAIGVPLPDGGKAYWLDHFVGHDVELIHSEAFRYHDRASADIDAYVRLVMETRRVSSVSADLRIRLAEKLRYFYDLFNTNLRYCEFSILLYRKGRSSEAPTLYTTYPSV